jgi:CheY-like chemotaxis protein
MSGDGNATILVVDDIPENVRLLDAVLAPRGYDVLTAVSGKEALDRVETSAPSRFAGRGRAFGRNTATSLRKPVACRTLAV